ncbi:hypothetical protein [Nonomuraea zeae]|uniref:hypothetical protein n=1 Tax=Nonomuraea zeae TaxID=1642303 RepID=UPI00197F586C|nr:hypothetical protein [Nonomuraea zeae]
MREPDSLDDQRFLLAGLRAMMRADKPEMAHLRVENLDDTLREWNCGFLLLKQRNLVSAPSWRSRTVIRCRRARISTPCLDRSWAAAEALRRRS